jgi:hypothetical protein
MNRILFSLVALVLGSTVIAQPANDSCDDAISIDDLFHHFDGQTYMSDIYTNVDATVSEDDPNFGLDCWLEIEFSEIGDPEPRDQTVWFSFVGDGSTYNIKSGDCGGTATNYIEGGDTQAVIFTGTCNALDEAVACNDDSPDIDWYDDNWDDWFFELDLETEDGVEYLLYVDGLNWEIFGDTTANPVAEGDFCVEVTSMTVNIEEMDLFSINTFPNPATDRVTIQSASPADQISLLDIQGREILVAEKGEKTLDVSELPSGIYSVVAEFGREIARQQLVIE